jgi:predicted GNAT family acetyltransferase
VNREFANEPDASRYALYLDGALGCVLDYSINGSAIALTRAYTQPPLRGHGYAAELVDYAVRDIATTTDRRVVPTCWYVEGWFQRNPERADVLSR